MLTLGELKGVGDATLNKLSTLDIQSVFGLLSFLPTKYIDLKAPTSIDRAKAGRLCLFEGTLEKVSSVSPRGRRQFYAYFKDTIAQGNLHFKVTVYNMPFLRDTLKVGEKYRLLGKLCADKGSYEIVNPKLELASKITNLGDGIFTVYPLGGVIAPNTFKHIVKDAIDKLMSEKYDGKFGKINTDMTNAFALAHLPKTLDEAEKGISALASIDLAIVLSIYQKLRQNVDNSHKVFYKSTNFRIDDYINALSFTPTTSQMKAFEEIEKDMCSSKNMSRVVSGDVGSGKTLVAFFAMCYAAKCGKQAALMVPTEILAHQHAKAFEKIAEKLDIKFAVLTSSTSQAERNKILSGLAMGDIECVIGTQSLIGEGVSYRALSLAVIDEQHKFGVNERKLLEDKGAHDVLSLTATPIPRSMALAFYDDIDISVIEKRKEASTNICTKIISSAEEGVQNVISECKKGKQAFIVCPSITDAEGFELASVEGFMKEFQPYFEGLTVKALHGKMKDDEKLLCAQEFAAGKIDILVATTVVEVGVDTKASEILILNGDRFGLATLHQLRGRVGRDGSPAHCYVECGEVSDKAQTRLSLFAKHNDGQYLAEVDFEMRGSGDMLGTRQSGISRTPIFGLRPTSDTLKSAKQYANEVLSTFSVSELVALARKKKAQIELFLSEVSKVTLNS